jgi:excisionase family DNA binding protein
MIAVLVATPADAAEARRLLAAAVHRLGVPAAVARTPIVVLAERSGVSTSDHRVADAIDDVHDGDVVGLFTLGDVAHRLGVSETTVRRMVDRGDLAVVRLGRAVRVRPADLQVFVDRLPAERRGPGRVVVLPGDLAVSADRSARLRGVGPS